MVPAHRHPRGFLIHVAFQHILLFFELGALEGHSWIPKVAQVFVLGPFWNQCIEATKAALWQALLEVIVISNIAMVTLLCQWKREYGGQTQPKAKQCYDGSKYDEICSSDFDVYFRRLEVKLALQIERGYQIKPFFSPD